MNVPADSEDKIDMLALLLIYLSSWQEEAAGISARRAWKGYDFDLLNRLEEKRHISQSRTAKSLLLTGKGLEKAQALQALLQKL